MANSTRATNANENATGASQRAGKGRVKVYSSDTITIERKSKLLGGKLVEEEENYYYSIHMEKQRRARARAAA